MNLLYQHKESCSAALCPDPVDIVNGMVTFNSIDDSATYTCNSGFELIGDATCIQGDANATFTLDPPFCRREHCVNETRVTTYLLLCITLK